MRKSARSTLGWLATTVIAASVAFTAGTVVTASSSPTPVTYYACLRDGNLKKVGTTPPTCGQRSEQVSWSQTGPAGPAGVPGAQGPQGPPGPGSEAYVFSIESITLGELPIPDPEISGPALVWWAGAECVHDAYLNGAYSTGSVGCVGLFPDGTTIPMRVINLPTGWNLDWGGAAVACGSAEFCEVTMSGDTEVTATYTETP